MSGDYPTQNRSPESIEVVYKPIPGFPGYEMGSDRSVWSYWHGRRYSKITEYRRQLRPSASKKFCLRFPNPTHQRISIHINKLYRIVFGDDADRIGGEFRDIEGFSGYKIRDGGVIVSNRDGEYEHLKVYRELNHKIDKDGYHEVVLYKDGIPYHKRVHELVLVAFGTPQPDNLICCHNDDNPNNNYVSNLRWDTHKGNSRDMVEHGNSCKGEKHHNHKLTDSDILSIKKLIDDGNLSQCDISRMFNVSQSTVSLIKCGKIWCHVT